MKKKLLALIATLALGVPMFAAFYMYVKLNNSDIFKFEVEDIEEVTHDNSGSTPDNTYINIKHSNGDVAKYNAKEVAEIYYEKIIVDSTIVNADSTPLTFRVLTDSTLEVSGYLKEYFVDEDGIISEKDIKIPTKVRIDTTVYSVTSIGNGAFSLCTGMTGIELPSTLTDIGSQAFNGCKALTELEIPNGVISIGEEAFQNCTGLANILIPSSVLTIEGWAFYGCDDLDVTVDNAKENMEIGQDAFEGCKSVTYTKKDTAVIDSTSNKMTFNILSETTVELSGGCADTVIVPQNAEIDGKTYTVSGIGNEAFANCLELRAIVLSSSITTIGEQAFMACSNLEIVNIPASVTEIKANAFYYCKKATIIIDNYEDSIKIGNTAFYNCDSVSYLKKHEIVPEDTIDAASGFPLKFRVVTDSTVEIIKDASYSVLDSITVPDTVVLDGKTYNVTSIADKAFSGCDSLVSIEIPTSVRNIGKMAFEGCVNLTSISIPEGVTTISDSTFYGCISLTNIKIPSNVSYIGHLAFNSCTNLDAVIDNSQDSMLVRDNAFEGCKSVTYTKPSEVANATDFSLVFKTLSDSTATIISCDNANTFGQINIPSKVRIDGEIFTVISIGNSVFERVSNLTGVKIPSSITSIGNSAFSFCTGLAKVEIEEGVTFIGEAAFSDCTNLRNIVIPSSVDSVAPQAFYYCKNLNIVVDNFEENIGVGTLAFGECKSVSYTKKHVIVDAATSLLSFTITSDSTAEVSGDSIKLAEESSVILPTKVMIEGKEYVVTSIGENAFVNCRKLTKIEISATITSIGSGAFGNCTGLTDIVIPSSITTIGQNAFIECTNLNVVINNIKDKISIGGTAFNNCKSVSYSK